MMPDWLQNSNYAAAFLWVIGAILLLILVLVLIRLIRSLTFGTFVSGGRNRKTRLAIMDATAVDSHRRLVLVRRDDIEHLILIGGSTDVVVEQNIRLNQSRRPMLAADPRQEPAQQPQRPTDQLRPPPPPSAAPASATPAAHEIKPAEPRRYNPLPTFQSLRATLWPEQSERQPLTTATATVPPEAIPPVRDVPFQRKTQSPPPQRNDANSNFREGRLNEPEMVQSGLPRPTAKEPRSIEDEMNRILSDLTSKF